MTVSVYCFCLLAKNRVRNLHTGINLFHYITELLKLGRESDRQFINPISLLTLTHCRYANRRMVELNHICFAVLDLFISSLSPRLAWRQLEPRRCFIR